MSVPFRFTRAVVLTAAMLSLAAGAHVLAGGVLPDPLVLFGLLALTLAPVMVLTGVELSAPVMTVLLGTSQLVLHQAFSGLSAAAGPAPDPTQHSHGAWAALPQAAALIPSRAQTAPDLLMVLAHAGATLTIALLLARGEAALWALAAWLRPLVCLPAAVVIHPRPHLRVPVVIHLPSGWRNLRLPALRGPPDTAAV